MHHRHGVHAPRGRLTRPQTLLFASYPPPPPPPPPPTAAQALTPGGLPAEPAAVQTADDVPAGQHPEEHRGALCVDFLQEHRHALSPCLRRRERRREGEPAAACRDLAGSVPSRGPQRGPEECGGGGGPRRGGRPAAAVLRRTRPPGGGLARGVGGGRAARAEGGGLRRGAAGPPGGPEEPA